MKQKIITIVILLFVSMNFSYAVDDNRNVNEKNLKDKDAYTQQMQINGENVVTEPLIMQEKMKAKKNNVVKRFFQKRKKRLSEKFGIDNLLSSNRILALMIVGFALLLPGMVLAMLGVALIPAIILAVVGGTLMIIGVLAGKQLIVFICNDFY